MSTLAKEVFSKYVVEDNVDSNKLSQVRYRFPNGYGASVIKGYYAHGTEGKPYEVAVLWNDRLCYDTYLTDDVIGYQDEMDVLGLLNQIKELPTKENEDE